MWVVVVVVERKPDDRMHGCFRQVQGSKHIHVQLSVKRSTCLQVCQTFRLLSIPEEALLTMRSAMADVMQPGRFGTKGYHAPRSSLFPAEAMLKSNGCTWDGQLKFFVQFDGLSALAR